MTDDAKPRRARGRPRGWDDKSAQNTIKSLDRAIDVLERLGELGGATLSALSADLGQPAASLYRVLVTLERRGLVEFDERDQIWQIGAGSFLIGARFLRRTSLVERARPVLRRLMAETGETANLGIARGGEVLFVSQVETHENIRAFFPPGTVSPMHASGIGKALLAHLPADQRDQVLAAGPLHAFTPRTITDPDALLADLARIRDRGFSEDAEEKTLGMRCIAAPVFDAQGEAVAGLSVSGPTSRVGDSDAHRFAEAVMRAAADLTRALGGTSAR